VTITALVLQAIKFFSTQKIMLGVISVILIFLAVFMIEEAIQNIPRMKKETGY